MKTISAIVGLVLMVPAMAAEYPQMNLVHPKGTNLVVVQLVRVSDLYAKFSGQTWITGTVVGRWPTGAKNVQDKNPEVLLVPDRKSVDSLPYFLLRDPPYLHHYKVRSIELINGREALKLAFSAQQLGKLLERRVDRVRVTGRFLVRQYVVGVECDAPWARAELVQVDIPQKMVSHQTITEGC